MIAYNILLFGDYPMLDYGHRIPLKIPARNDIQPNLTHIIIAEPDHYEKSFKLLSGQVDFLHLIGITQSEYEYAKAHTSEKLLMNLKKSGVYPLTDRNRKSIF